MTPKEFIDIYLPLGEAMYRTAFYILESQADAEDAVQDLYIRLWNSRDNLHAVKNPKAYCLTLMKNTCIDRIRQSASKQGCGELHDNIPASTAADEGAIGKETAKRIAEAIRGLPESQRKVLQMRTFESLSNNEISQRTGMSNLTVRVLLSQARKTLRKALEQE